MPPHVQFINFSLAFGSHLLSYQLTYILFIVFLYHLSLLKESAASYLVFITYLFFYIKFRAYDLIV